MRLRTKIAAATVYPEDTGPIVGPKRKGRKPKPRPGKPRPRAVRLVEPLPLELGPQGPEPDDEPETSHREVELGLLQKAAEARAKLHELCRNDVNAFIEYVIRDAKTGECVEQNDFHLQFQRDLTE